MELLTPNLGLVFWTTVIFVIVFFLLKKFAWPVILGALRERENYIEDSLQSAERAKEEMAAMKSEHEKLLNEAKEERASILKEAKAAKENMISEARDKAKEEAAKVMESTRREINNQKEAALAELRTQVGQMAVEIAEKILHKELQDPQEQEKYINHLVEDIKPN